MYVKYLFFFKKSGDVILEESEIDVNYENVKIYENHKIHVEEEEEEENKRQPTTQSYVSFFFLGAECTFNVFCNNFYFFLKCSNQV